MSPPIAMFASGVLRAAIQRGVLRQRQVSEWVAAFNGIDDSREALLAVAQAQSTLVAADDLATWLALTPPEISGMVAIMPLNDAANRWLCRRDNTWVMAHLPTVIPGPSERDAWRAAGLGPEWVATSAGDVCAIEPWHGGRSLARWWRTHPDEPMAEGLVLSILLRSCGSLKNLHRASLAHGSIDAEHILLDRHARPHVVGSGCYNAQAPVDADYWPWAAPERLAASAPQPASPAADVFALGVVGYRLLTGTMPYQANAGAERTAAGIRQHTLSSPRPNCQRIVPAISSLTAKTIAKALAGEASDRYADALELGRSLKRNLQRLRQEPSDPAMVPVASDEDVLEALGLDTDPELMLDSAIADAATVQPATVATAAVPASTPAGVAPALSAAVAARDQASDDDDLELNDPDPVQPVTVATAAVAADPSAGIAPALGAALAQRAQAQPEQAESDQADSLQLGDLSAESTAPTPQTPTSLGSLDLALSDSEPELILGDIDASLEPVDDDPPPPEPPAASGPSDSLLLLEPD